MGVSVHSKDTREREIEQINGMSNNIALSYLGAEPDTRPISERGV